MDADLQNIGERPRGAEQFEFELRRARAGIDRQFLILLALQWLACTGAALVVSPHTWIGRSSFIHIHVWLAAGLGFSLFAFPVWVARRWPGMAVTRHCIAISQMMFSALLIHVTGGRMESHFHIFGSLAFLAFYRDWRVLLTATAMVAIDHWFRGVWWPQSVFGTDTSSSWRWMEHAGWVLFEDSVLVLSINRGLREARELSDQRAELEFGKENLDRQVRDRTTELETARVEAETANRTKSEFLANMSHEIRTPMTAIMGYAELMEDPGLNFSEHASHLGVIRRNGEHLLSVINDILDISKIEVGQLTVEHKACRICQIVAEVAALMRVRASAKGLTLTVRYEFPVPEEIESDPVRVRQILMNLVGNAVKFTDRGSISISVRSISMNGAAPSISVDVTDTGIGMNGEALKRLFKPFSQVDSSQTRRHGGTGLGLAISKRLAEALGGELGVVSKAGEGSTFTLGLPAGKAQERDAPHTPGAPSAMADDAGKFKFKDRLRARILLAEDGPDNQRLFAFQLRKAGAEVEVVEDGRQAVSAALSAAAEGRPFRVILMDMQMPVMDGYTATRTLRERGYVGAILALTAHAMTGDREKCLAAGCDGYQSKPVSFRNLIEAVEKYCTDNSGMCDRAIGRAA